MFKNLINFDSFSLTKKIFFFMVLLSILTLVTTSLIVFYSNKQSQSKFKILRLEQKENQINEAFIYLLTSYDITPENAISIIEKRLFEISDINNTDLNVFDLNGYLKLTTEGKIRKNTKKLNSFLLKKLKTENRIVLSYDYKNDLDTDLTIFFYVYNIKHQPVAIVSIPHFYDEFKEKKDFDSLLFKFLFLFLFLTIGSGIIAWIFSNTITNKLKNIAEKIKQTQVLENNFRIEYEADDEVKVLVSAYNEMLEELKHQKNMIRLMERDLLWKEMAKQVAHEVRNPLTPMSLMIQNFKRTFNPLDPNIKQKVNSLSDSLIQQIEVISSISNSFSDFAKLPDRKDQMIDLVRETKNVLYIFGENITLQTSNQIIEYFIDEVYFNRIITNLLKNAVESTKDKKNKIKIIISIIKNKDEIIISIKDNGYGIKEEIKPFLFEPKFTTKQYGMGLGLPMVQKIIQEYNGTIRFESILGEGTKFIVTLPLNI